MDDTALLARAREAREHAYAPYSEYPVGAALLTTDGAVITGCNVGNANYDNALCAERVALVSAVADGHRSFEAIAVASDGEGVTPCGACRQSLAEFCDDDVRVVCETAGGHERYTLGDLLPAAFRPSDVS